jgi:hypothetical protein
VNRSAAFNTAERARRRFVPAAAPQRSKIAYLSRTGGIEEPIGVRTSSQASKVLNRLEAIVRQPTLGPM